MRAMPIQVKSTIRGSQRAIAALKKNIRHYVQEALGLAVFMISACFFSAAIYSPEGWMYEWLHYSPGRDLVMGLLMGGTAAFIFYSPFTAPSGSQINPAVTLTFLRMGRMCKWDTFFYILFQFAGGTLAVFLMQFLLGDSLTAAPVHSAVTIPVAGTTMALFTETAIAFVTMSVVLFADHLQPIKKYTRIIIAALVACWVIFAGPVSGFGMNPARTFASALPSGIWTGFWIYILAPLVGMLAAAQCYLAVQSIRRKKDKRIFVRVAEKTKGLIEPLEFLL